MPFGVYVHKIAGVIAPFNRSVAAFLRLLRRNKGRSFWTWTIFVFGEEPEAFFFSFFFLVCVGLLSSAP